MFYVLKPEVPGGFGEKTVLDHSIRPRGVQYFHLEMEDWLGDDILKTHPCYVVTEKLCEVLSKSGMSGFSFTDKNFEVTKSDQFDMLYRGSDLPRFYWMNMSGVACIDDAGIFEGKHLTVSERFLATLRENASLNGCLVRDAECGESKSTEGRAP